jgi:hypothetical protein
MLRHVLCIVLCTFRILYRHSCVESLKIERNLGAQRILKQRALLACQRFIDCLQVDVAFLGHFSIV